MIKDELLGKITAHKATIGVVGLGYVGLPLAVEFGKKFRTIGFDLSAAKVEAYSRCVDPTGEVSSSELEIATQLHCTTDSARLKEANFIVVAVPTPIDDAHQPDFGPLLGASESVPIVDGRLVFGQWQRIFLVELDHGRDREVVVHLVGE